MNWNKKIILYPSHNEKIKSDKKEQTIIEKQINLRSQSELEEELPVLPRDRIEWEYFCRPMIKGTKNRLKYRPMLLDVVKDQHPFIMMLFGRQWGKTTILGTDLAYYASINYDYDQTYFNFKLDNLRTFSENKFRQDVFGSGPLMKYISGISKLGAMNRVVLKTRSVIDMLLPGPNWENAQGKSNRKMVVDEGQDHSWTNFQNARETQADTFGDLKIAGIGGYTDTEYHNIWKTTNQMAYEFKRGENYQGYENMSWRSDLEFNDEGLIEDHYLLDVLDGKYVAAKPENFSRHGYHLPQTYNPRIPLTMEDAISKYKISPEFSIEWKEKKDPNFSMLDYRRNVMAEFVEGELKPITTADMLNLFDKTVSLTKADDVDHAAGDVIIGIDWGGGGKTIVWIWQCIDESAPIFKLLWVERVETADTEEQFEICKNLIDAYEANFVSIDAGGAPDRVQAIQKRYGTRSTRVTYQVRPEKPMPTREEMIKQESEMRYVIDRTFSINRIIDMIKHPFQQKDFTSNRIILPGADYESVKWIVKQFVALEGEKTNLKSTGQTYIKYIHKDTEPDDALQACNYAFIGWDVWRTRSPGAITFKQINKPDPYGDEYY